MKIIYYDKILNNLLRLQAQNDLCVVLKNDAYNFKISKVVGLCEKAKVNSYAINSLDEAIKVRSLTKKPIILLGLNKQNVSILKKYNIYPCANTQAEITFYTNLKIDFVIEIDTGMNRFGLKNYDESIFVNPYVKYVIAHFYKDMPQNYDQMLKIANLCLKHNIKFNFGGSMLVGKTNYPLRVGRIIYEHSTAFWGQVIFVKQVYKGQMVGYEGEYIAQNDEKIAVIDVGYCNGLRPNFKGRVCCNNRFYQVVGRICMNHTFIKIDDDVQIGDVVEFYGVKIDENEFLKNNNMSLYESFFYIK